MDRFLIQISTRHITFYLRAMVLSLLSVMVISCSTYESQQEQSLRQDIAQKLMLDFRYFCTKVNNEEPCKSKMTELPTELKT